MSSPSSGPSSITVAPVVNKRRPESLSGKKLMTLISYKEEREAKEQSHNTPKRKRNTSPVRAATNNRHAAPTHGTSSHHEDITRMRSDIFQMKAAIEELKSKFLDLSSQYNMQQRSCISTASELLFESGRPPASSFNSFLLDEDAAFNFMEDPLMSKLSSYKKQRMNSNNNNANSSIADQSAASTLRAIRPRSDSDNNIRHNSL